MYKFKTDYVVLFIHAYSYIFTHMEHGKLRAIG